MNTKEIILIWGATGDLAKKKLIPAIFQLYRKKKISHTPVICLGRRSISKEEYIKESKLDLLKLTDKKMYERYMKNIYYKQVDMGKDEKELGSFVKTIARSHNAQGSVITYFALPSNLFENALNHMQKAGLVNKKLLVACEKPFGTDSASATRLNKAFTKKLSEGQIYRVDHYLGKSSVNSLLDLRFSNPLLETFWSPEHIDNIQFVFSEDFGVGSRGEYYDSAGAIRDFVQNHILQVIALVTMDKPKKKNSEEVEKEKDKILSHLAVLPKEEIIRGQYEGYTKEDNIKEDSKTETFVAFKTVIKKTKWKDVPLYIKTGKFLDKKCSEINIVLKKKPLQKVNVLSIRIGPEQEGFVLQMYGNNPFKSKEMKTITAEYCHNCEYGPNTPQAYENIFEELFRKDKTIFPSWNEVKKSWKFTDHLIEVAKKTPLHKYKKGSRGPTAADKLLKKDKRSWAYVKRKITI